MNGGYPTVRFRQAHNYGPWLWTHLCWLAGKRSVRFDLVERVWGAIIGDERQGVAGVAKGRTSGAARSEDALQS